MKFDITLHAASEGSEHHLELRAAGAGGPSVLVDGVAAEADWTEITPGVYSIILGGRPYEAHVTTRPDAADSCRVKVGAREFVVEVRDPRARRNKESAGLREGPQELLAPMPGKIVKVLVSENQQVDAGEGLVVIEAMKMQNELRAPRAGRVERIYVVEGAGVETGFKLLRLA